MWFYKLLLLLMLIASWLPNEGRTQVFLNADVDYQSEEAEEEEENEELAA